MNVIELNRALRQLRLGGMAAVLETRLHQAQAEPMSCPGAAAHGPCQPQGMSTVSRSWTSTVMSMSCPGELDVRWNPRPGCPAGPGATGDMSGVRIGVITELGGEGYQAGVQQRFDEAVALLVGAGAEVVEVSCPSFVHALAAYYLIMSA